MADRSVSGPWRMPDGSVNWREPTQPGNKLALRHGANSPQLMDERAAELLEELVEVMPWLAECDALLVETLSRSLAQFRALDDYVGKVISGEAKSYPRKGHPQTGVEGVPAVVFEQWARAQRAVESTAAKLGMAPATRSRMFKDTGWARALDAQVRGARLADLRRIGGELRGKSA